MKSESQLNAYILLLCIGLDINRNKLYVLVQVYDEDQISKQLTESK